jgi:ATP-dependent Clp protease ATP-binding subunit ClpC
VGQLTERLKEKDIHLKLSARLKDMLVEKGFDPAYGARPVKRTIQRMVEDPLSEELLKGAIKDGETVQADHEGQRTVFKSLKAKPAARKKQP